MGLVAMTVDRGLQLIAAQAELNRQPLLAEHVDPLDVFNKLVREVDAGRVLVQLVTTPNDRRRAALDALNLARDVLDDARRLLDGEPS